ncbi:MAG: T9SS type A sorting domain-containing protein [Bacteroidetes bacterium]|nr:MAG: T9SS type A sorting domain-containing protein [Bacteroidota bacterium]
MGHFNATAMRITFLLLFNLIWFQSNSQSNIYHTFPVSDGVWRVDWGEQSCFSSGLPQANYRYIMNGDSVINGISYHKIEREYGSSIGCGPFYPQGNGYMGGLREDSLNRLIYFVPRDSINESLLYDFNLSVGDTLPSYFIDLFGLSYTTITSIDSMLIGSEYRKVLHSIGNSFVEGIGSLAGLLETQRLDLTPNLVCYIQDGIELYQYFPGVSCDLISSIDEKMQTKDDVDIFPNPFNTACTIRVDYRSTFILYNLLGIEVKRINCVEGSNVLDREQFSSGLYFYEVIGSKNKNRGRIVMN